MSFWFLDESPVETPGFGGYSYGVIDESNPLPKGAMAVINKAQLNKQIKSSEKAFSKSVDEFSEDIERRTIEQIKPSGDGVSEMSVVQIRKHFRGTEAYDYAVKLGLQPKKKTETQSAIAIHAHFNPVIND